MSYGIVHQLFFPCCDVQRSLQTLFLDVPVTTVAVLPCQDLKQSLVVVRDIAMSRNVARALVAPISVWQLLRDIPEGRPLTTRGCHEEGTRKKVSTNGVFISDPPDEGFRPAQKENHRLETRRPPARVLEQGGPDWQGLRKINRGPACSCLSSSDLQDHHVRNKIACARTSLAECAQNGLRSERRFMCGPMSLRQRLCPSPERRKMLSHVNALFTVVSLGGCSLRSCRPDSPRAGSAFSFLVRTRSTITPLCECCGRLVKRNWHDRFRTRLSRN